ncbi:MAG: hypothetical protein KC503_14430 [Myxococcales bacterium]|nr:hypothetical protein [Myxococcales bacterium]
MSAIRHAAFAATLTLVAPLASVARAAEPTTPTTPSEQPQPRAELRIATPRGPIRVYRPALSRPPLETIIYVHGYYAKLDDSWGGHDLVDQFKASGRPAVFIAVEAPVGPRDTVRFPDLAQVLALVEKRSGWTLPRYVVGVGHSGAYRTLLRWLGEKRLRHLVLLDVLYAGEQSFANWFNGSRDRRLTVVVRGTMKRTRMLEKRIRGRVTWCRRIPTMARGFSRRCRRARAAFITSQLGHGAIAVSGKGIPVVLRDRLPRR